MLESIDHVIIAVRDLTRATETYSRLLGRRPSWRGRHPEQGTANALFQLANTYLELLAPEGEGMFADMLRAHLDEKGESLYGLAFATGDLDAACEALREAGLAPSAPRAANGKDEATGSVRHWRMAFLPADRTRGVLAFLIEHDVDSPPLEPAPLEAGPESAVVALDHVVLRTSAPEAAIELYRDLLGIRLALDRSFEERGVRLIFFRLGGMTLEVASALGEGDESSGADQLWGLAYQVPEVREARDRLSAADFDVTDVRSGNKPGTAVFSVRAETHGVPTLLIGPD